MKYLEMVKEDVIEAIKNDYILEDYMEEGELNRDELEEKLNEDLWIDDSVTGNGSGSYTFNSNQAREYVLEDTATVREALEEFCVSPEEIGEHFLNEDWEYLDVTARCYVLSWAISEALDDIEDDIEG